MISDLIKKFKDRPSMERAAEIASQNKIGRVDIAHLFALLNGVPVSELRGVQGKVGKRYYNLIYGIFGSGDAWHDVTDVVAAYNKKFRDHVSLGELRIMTSRVINIDDDEDTDSFKSLVIEDANDIGKVSEAYYELLDRYNILKEEFNQLRLTLRRTKAELAVTKIEKQVLKEMKEKMIETFRLQS